jgi:hypothetical protein
MHLVVDTQFVALHVLVSSAYLNWKWIWFCKHIIYARNILVLTVTIEILSLERLRNLKISKLSEALYYGHLLSEGVCLQCVMYQITR